MGVLGDAVADHFRVDARPALPRLVKPLQDHDPGALAHHEPIAILVERPAGALRFVVAPAHRAHVLETSYCHGNDSRFGAAADHDIGPAAPDEIRRLADRMAAGRTGSGNGQVRPARADHDAQMCGRAVKHQARHGERTDPPRATLAHNVMLFEEDVNASDARTHQHTDAPCAIESDIQLGIGCRLLGRRGGKMQETIHAPRFPLVHIAGRVEVLHLCGDVRLEQTVVELRHRCHTGLAGQDGAPTAG
jgi:hypothetical protein